VTTVRRRARLLPVAASLVALLAIGPLSACGDGDADASVASAPLLPAEDVEPTVAVSTTAPATTAAPVTAAPTTTSLPPTTLPATTAAPTTTAPPTVVETLPTPMAPPEPRAAEPYVELGRISIPKIGLDEPLLEGISLTVLDQGPGHWPGTARPGTLGNAVVAGHRTSHGKEFRNLDQLVAGDEVVFTTPDGTYRYLVRETTIVKPDAMYIIEQTEAYTATLFACHPPGSTRQRIVVHLDLAPDQLPA
jgi:sortase A